MISWKSVPSESPIKWFLEEENSSVRYLTLRDVLDRSERDRDVVTAKKQLPFPGSQENLAESKARRLFFSFVIELATKATRAFLAVRATDISDVLHRLLYSEGLDGEDHSSLWNYVF